MFQNSCAIETGPLNVPKIIVTAMKSTFQKLKSKIVHYRDYKKISNDEFRKSFLLKTVELVTVVLKDCSIYVQKHYINVHHLKRNTPMAKACRL